MSPRHRLLGAAALLGGLVLLALVRAATSASPTPRVLLALAVVASLAAWRFHTRPQGSAPGAFRATPRLAVVQRAGLSARTAVALLGVDGRPFLVVHGEGFAQVTRVARPLPVGPRVDIAGEVRR